MPKKKAKKRKRRAQKPAEIYTRLSLVIEDYRVRAIAGINRYAHDPKYAFRDPQEENLYEFLTHLEIMGRCTDPEERASDNYTLTIYTEQHPDSDIYWKLKDIQLLDEHRVPQYKSYRSKDVPIYRPPKGMGVLDKERGEPSWHGSIWARPAYVTDLLVLLSHNRQLDLEITEKKIERQRWIQHISVQTTDPAEE